MQYLLDVVVQSQMWSLCGTEYNWAQVLIFIILKPLKAFHCLPLVCTCAGATGALLRSNGCEKLCPGWAAVWGKGDATELWEANPGGESNRSWERGEKKQKKNVHCLLLNLIMIVVSNKIPLIKKQNLNHTNEQNLTIIGEQTKSSCWNWCSCKGIDHTCKF